MAKVGIVMGSDSDMPIMAQAAEVLEQFGIDFEMTIISAHREPDTFFEYAKSAESKGMKVIIAGAGKAAHLPGMCAAIFPLPVIGIPMKTSDLGGVDSLYSIVQISWRKRFTVFNRTDAVRNPGSDRSDQRRKERRNPCGKDPCGIRSGTP